MDIQFRKAESRDIDEIMILIEKAITNMERDHIFQWDNLYPTAEDFESDIRQGHLEVGEMDGVIAVVYAVNQDCDEQYKNGKWNFPSSRFCVVHRLCVNPDFQNRGVARKTLEHIETTQRGMGVESIRLDVFTQNPHALSLYKHAGYESVGEANWRKGKFLLMEKYLKEEITIKNANIISRAI